MRYNPAMQNDTIAAIATPPGSGGIGVIRVSGQDAFSLVLPLFRQPHGRSTVPPSHQLTYGHVVDPATNEILDEVLAAFMFPPIPIRVSQWWRSRRTVGRCSCGASCVQYWRRARV